MSPGRAQPRLVAAALLLALPRLPAPDFLYCSHLVTPGCGADPAVGAALAMAAHLEAARFPQFWALVPNPADRAYPGTGKAHVVGARGFIASQLASLYSRCPAHVAAEALALDGGAQMAQWMASSGQAQGWAVEAGGGGAILMPRTPGNSPAVAQAEAVSFSKLAGLFATGVAA